MATPEIPREPQGGQDRTATRRLCAGVYVDTEYRTTVIQRVYNERRRRVAPSYGYDLVPVLAHAWRAWRLSTAEDALVLAEFCAAYATYPMAAFLATATLVDLALAGSLAVRLSKRYVALRGAPEADTPASPPAVQDRTLRRGIYFTTAAMLVALILLIGTSGAWGLVTAALIMLAPCVTLAGVGAFRQLALNRLRAQRATSPPLRTSRRLSVIDGQQQHPMVVYSGVQPFIGSGTVLTTWSFAQRLVEAKELDDEKDVEFTKKPFFTWDMVEKLRHTIAALGTEDDPETKLPGITVSDSLFVESRYARSYASELADRPQADLVRRILDNPPETARHYLTCQVESWGGDVVTTVFVHVSLQGRTLYIEFTTCGLAPIRLEYQVVDVVGGTGRMAMVRSCVTSLRRLPLIALAPFRLTRAFVLLAGAVRAGADSTPLHLKRGADIGAALSAREMATVASDASYFQSFDVGKHSKIVERRLLVTIGEFLKEHGVDTSEFLERATAILNNGIINTGSGNVEVSDSTIAMGHNTNAAK
ncbi:hypothetical protein [Streptomyces violascens]|uniref:hypothetical protein n=1 Tax=Streptomyces violascens TaxID=67381 RepID=UPI0036BC19F6